MKALTKVFNGTELPIEVINDREFMIDVSGIARKFGKNFTDWSRGKRVKETLSALEKSNALNLNLIDTSIVGKTMIHNKLLISFARFISVEFEMWCDDQIYDILLGFKDDKILELAETKTLCNVYDGKMTSCRGLIQHLEDFEFTEDSWKQTLYKAGYIIPKYVRVKQWELTDKGINSDFLTQNQGDIILYDLKLIPSVIESITNENQYLIPNAEPIHVYNGFTGEYHCTFPSLNEAERELGVSGISGILNGTRGDNKKHIRGICFRRGEDAVDEIEPLSGGDLSKIFRDINVYKDGEFLKSCKTMKQAGEIGGNGATQVSRLLKNGKSNQGGYSYKYAELSFKKRVIY